MFQNKERNDMKELLQSFKEIFFNIMFPPYPDTTSILLVGIGSQQLAFIGIFYNVFRSWAVTFSQSQKVSFWTIQRFFYILKQFAYRHCNFSYVYSVTGYFILSDINFLSMASFSCDMRLRKINTVKGVFIIFKTFKK